MDTIRKSPLLIAIASVALMSGCSEEAEVVVNESPTLALSTTSFTVNEGQPFQVEYTVTDDSTATGSISVVVLDSAGRSRNDPGYALSHAPAVQDGKITYTATWLQNHDEKTLSESFIVRATDKDGATVEQRVSATVKDINSPVKVVINPPSGASGWQNTQQDDALNFWFPEGQSLSVTFNLADEDADVIDLEARVTEGLVFTNQIESSLSENGKQVTLRLQVPTINTVSESFTLSLVANDGDDTVTASANVTVVNKPTLSWAQGSPSTLAESTGGSLTYTSSEMANYPGDYTLVVTDENDQPLDFDLPVSFSSVDKKITFGASSPIQSNKTVKVLLSLTNVIRHAGGESYSETTVISRSLILQNDRDDDFDQSVKGFYSQLEQFEGAKSRRDEARVASAMSSYLFLRGSVTFGESDSIKKTVSALLDQELVALSTLAERIISDIEDKRPNAEVLSLISEFQTKSLQVGATARTRLHETIVEIENELGQAIPLKKPVAGGVAKTYKNELTHYVGNNAYGTFSDEAKTKWVFSTGYEYLSVADYSTGYCF